MQGWRWRAAGAVAVTAALAAMTGAWSATRGSGNAGSPRVVRLGTMTTARAAHQATLLRSGVVLVTGGCTAPGCDQIVASLIDAQTGIPGWNPPRE